MKPIPLVLSALLALALLTGCKPELVNQAQEAKIQELELKLTSQAGELTRLETVLHNLGTNVANALTMASHATNSLAELKDSIWQKEFKEMMKDDPAEFAIHPETTSHEIVHSSHGPMAVGTEKVSPYLDGFEFTLRIGNLTSATISSPPLKVRWPRKLADGNYTQVERVLSITQDLKPGWWNDVSLKLTDIKLHELKAARFTFQPERIELKVLSEHAPPR